MHQKQLLKATKTRINHQEPDEYKNNLHSELILQTKNAHKHFFNFFLKHDDKNSIQQEKVK